VYRITGRSNCQKERRKDEALMKKSCKRYTAAVMFVAVSLVAVAALAGGNPMLDIQYHDLDVRLDPDSHELKGLDRIEFGCDERAVFSFYLGTPFNVKRATLDGRRVKLERIEIDYEADGEEEDRVGTGEEEHPENRILYRLPAVKPGEHVLEIEYRGVVYDTLTVPEASRSGLPSETTGLIGGEGTYLGGYQTGWYPDGRDDYARFSIRITTPAGVESVTEGKRAGVQRKEKTTITDWEVNYPTQHVTVMAADYLVRERSVDGVTLMAYFFPSEEDLIDTYLDASERYIELYNQLIGPYPFSKFAVVENFFPTGYGMPSYTLLGRRIVRMPFIVRTSLGHEVAHNWWGNCVYPDYQSGNWCEGLTTYYADYRYEAQKGDSAAVVYRRDINIDYATHVTDSTDIPLTAFRSREDEVTDVVGYGKCTMVFHMLKSHLGEDKFYRAMRNFYRQYRFEEADWEDIESVCEEAHGGPLDGFFDQWVRRAGAPRLSLVDVFLEEPPDAAGDFVVRATIGNEGGFVLPGVPVEITTPTVTRRIFVTVTGEAAVFDWRLQERPLRIAVDPDHDLFRKLSPAKIPVTISRVLADVAPLIVLPSSTTPGKAEAYRKLAERLASTDEARVAVDTVLVDIELTSRAVFIMGGVAENGVYELLEPSESVKLVSGEIGIGGERYIEPGHSAFVAFTNMLDSSQTVCAIVGNSADAVTKAGYKVIYYGKYSYVTFLDGDKQDSGVFPVPPGPLEYRFDEAAVSETESESGAR
jgi:hypothetical protein